jgi:hypothetical protein
MLEFRLTYRGPLKSRTSATKLDKHRIRQHLRTQLKALWEQEPLSRFQHYIDPNREHRDGNIELLQPVGQYLFAPLVTQAQGWNAVCSVDILFMRPSSPGQLVGHGGDLDNRLKTLFDAMRVPQLSELPDNSTPESGEKPFHCLLQDDALVAKIGVTADRLLAPCSPNDVELILHIAVSSTSRTMGNDPIW